LFDDGADDADEADEDVEERRLPPSVKSSLIMAFTGVGDSGLFSFRFQFSKLAI
jgi:hypothetical protein